MNFHQDNLMLKDINQHLTNVEKINLPVGVKDCIEAGIIAMKIDESRKTGKIIDLTSSWSRLRKPQIEQFESMEGAELHCFCP